MFTDEQTEQPGIHDDPNYLAQDEEGNETLTSEGHGQTTAEQQTDYPGSAGRAIDDFDEGESSHEAEPEQAQPADDEESTVGPLSGDEHTEQPTGAAEDDREPEAAAVTNPDSDYLGPTEGLDAAAAHEHSDDYSPLLFGENSIEYEEAVATNDNYESAYNENDLGGEHGETVAIEGDARFADWETTTPDAQHTQDDLEQHKDQDDAEETDKREQVACVVSADDLTSPFTDSPTIDPTIPNHCDDCITGQQGKYPSLLSRQDRLTLQQTPILTRLDNEHWTNL